MVLGEQIKQKALELGFDLVGITDASPVSADQVARLVCWINAGRAGQMGWIRENLDKRVDPAKFLPGAKSIIVVGLNYKSPQQNTADRGRTTVPMGRVAHFAQYEDYHPFIKKLLRKLVKFLVDAAGAG